jgi:hypothetical protein
VRIESGFADKLTADPVYCIDTQDGDQACKSIDVSPGTPGAVKVFFNAPNGNTGPETTLTIQQTGSSVEDQVDGTCTLSGFASHVRVKDTHGNLLLMPFGATSCCQAPTLLCP